MNRRGFLRNAGLFLAGLPFFRHLPRGKPEPPRKNSRIIYGGNATISVNGVQLTDEEFSMTWMLDGPAKGGIHWQPPPPITLKGRFTWDDTAV